MMTSSVTISGRRSAHPVSLLFCGLLLLSLSSASALEGACNVIKQLGNCKAVIRIPTLAFTYCDIPSVKIDKCQTKLKGRYPCGVSLRGVKWCDGWTCIPGPVPTTIRAPCGVKVGSKPLDLCSVARKAVPKMDELAKQAGGICTCLPKILDFVDLDTVKAAVTSLDASDAMASILNKYGDAQVCLIDNGFNVRDNKKGLTENNGALVTSKNVKVFTAAEIDLSRYIALAAALAPCFFVPPACNQPAVRGFFTDYMTDSEKLLGQQITEFLTPWQKAFDGIGSGFESIGNDLEQIGGEFETIKSGVANITDDFCRNMTACADTTVSKLQKQALDSIKNAEAFTGLTSDIEKAVAQAKEAFKTVNEAILSFETLTDLGIENIVSRVLAGDIRNIKDIAATLQSVQKLPRIVSNIQKSVPVIQAHVEALQTAAPDFLQNIESILQDSWLADAKADRASADAAEAAVRQIQALFRDSIVPHATAVSDSIASLVKSLELVFVSGPPSIDPPGVASYQRWSQGHFAMPCLTTGKVTLNLGIYKKQVDYPKFYRCEQDYRIPFPNHHIPYIRVTFGSSSPSRRTAPFVLGAREDVVVVSLTEPNAVETPTLLTASWPHISDATGSEASATPTELDEYDPTATEIDVGAAAAGAAATSTLPPDVYTNSADVPSPTALPPGLVFFSTTDANGAVVESSTMLNASETFEVTATEIMTTAVVTDAPEITTPAGFQEGTIGAEGGAATTTTAAGSGADTTGTGTGTGTDGAASASSTSGSAAAVASKLALGSLLVPMGLAFCLL